MKKFLIMCLALMSVTAFAGCARGYDSSTGINYRNGYNRYNTYDEYDEYDGYEDTYDTNYNGNMYNNRTNYNGTTSTPVR